eukprot:TRINITY_DN11811_c0_g1_i1.p1 TRINITY_DN11811_c0_g1~~TRINITY_DN11811_c0_g1_i1.p1  ORF type:complete len:260 (+),score=29.14 TRINITY_DN11811_c0_g1_i1:21-800(+)
MQVTSISSQRMDSNSGASKISKKDGRKFTGLMADTVDTTKTAKPMGAFKKFAARMTLFAASLGTLASCGDKVAGPTEPVVTSPLTEAQKKVTDVLKVMTASDDAVLAKYAKLQKKGGAELLSAGGEIIDSTYTYDNGDGLYKGMKYNDTLSDSKTLVYDYTFGAKEGRIDSRSRSYLTLDQKTGEIIEKGYWKNGLNWELDGEGKAIKEGNSVITESGGKKLWKLTPNGPGETVRQYFSDLNAKSTIKNLFVKTRKIVK